VLIPRRSLARGPTLPELHRRIHITELARAAAALGAEGVAHASLRSSHVSIAHLREAVAAAAAAASEARTETLHTRSDAARAPHVLRELLSRAEHAVEAARARTADVEAATGDAMAGFAADGDRELASALAGRRRELEQELRTSGAASSRDRESLRQRRELAETERERARKVADEFEALRSAVSAQRAAQAAEQSQLESRVRELEAEARMRAGSRGEVALREAEDRARARAQAAAARAAEAMVLRTQSTNERAEQAAKREVEHSVEALLSEREREARGTLEDQLSALEAARADKAREAAGLRDRVDAVSVRIRAAHVFERASADSSSGGAQLRRLRQNVRVAWASAGVPVSRRRIALEGMLWAWKRSDELEAKLRVMSARLEERRRRRDGTSPSSRPRSGRGPRNPADEWLLETARRAVGAVDSVLPPSPHY